MRLVELPGKLPPGMQLFPPLTSQSLSGSSTGLQTGVPQVGEVPYEHLAAVSVCTVPSQGAEVPMLLLFAGGQRRPVAVEVTKIRTRELGIEGAPHRPENLRKLVLALLRRAPHAAVDSATFEFLQGRMLRSRGERLSDLADAVGLSLVNGSEIREVDFPAAAPDGAPPPAAPASPPSPPPAPSAAEPTPATPPAPTRTALWVHPEHQALMAFLPGVVFLVGRDPTETQALAQHIAAGADPRTVLAGRAFEIPSSAFAHVRRSRETKCIELEYRSADGPRKLAVPYGHEAAGQELFATLRQHLGASR